MVASNQTIRDIYTVLRRHATDNQIGRILSELSHVRGNKSFTQTVHALAVIHINQRKEEE